MGKVVLGVGHCGFDSSRIAAVVATNGGKFENVASADAAIKRAKAGDVAVIIPNRVIDGDQEGGLKVIKAVKADADASHTPIALISGIAEAQKAAQAVGAEPGIGKDMLEANAGKAFFKKYLP